MLGFWGGQSCDVSQLSRISTPLDTLWCFVLLWGTRCLAESIHEWRFGASPLERSAAEFPLVRCDRAGENCPGCGDHTQERLRRRQTRCCPGVRGVSFLHSFLLLGLIASYIQYIFMLYLVITWQIGVGLKIIKYHRSYYCTASSRTGSFKLSCPCCPACRRSVIGRCRATVQV